MFIADCCGSFAGLELHSQCHACVFNIKQAPLLQLVAEADAFAAQDQCGLGGYILWPSGICDGIPSTCSRLRFRNCFHQWKANCSITFVRWNCLLSIACSGLHLKCYLELVIILLCRCAPTTPAQSWSLPRGLHQSKFWARVLRAFLDFQRRNGLHASVEHIPGYRNDLADELSRP